MLFSDSYHCFVRISTYQCNTADQRICLQWNVFRRNSPCVHGFLTETERTLIFFCFPGFRLSQLFYDLPRFCQVQLSFSCPFLQWSLSFSLSNCVLVQTWTERTSHNTQKEYGVVLWVLPKVLWLKCWRHTEHHFLSVCLDGNFVACFIFPYFWIECWCFSFSSCICCSSVILSSSLFRFMSVSSCCCCSCSYCKDSSSAHLRWRKNVWKPHRPSHSLPC